MTRWAPFLMMLVADVFPGGCCGGARYHPPPQRALPENIQGAVMAYSTLRSTTFGASSPTGRCADESICETRAIGDTFLVFGKKAGATDVTVSFADKYNRFPLQALPVHVTIVDQAPALPALSLGDERRGAPFALAGVKVGDADPRDYACYPGSSQGADSRFDVGDVVRGDAEVARCHPPRELGGASYRAFDPGPEDDSLEVCVHRTTRDSKVVSLSIYQTTKGAGPAQVEHRGPAEAVCSIAAKAR